MIEPETAGPIPILSCYTQRKLMRVLGIDCGGEYTGYGVVEQDEQGGLHHLCSGAIRLLPREALELRLKKICQGLTDVIAAYSPEVVTIEDVFYAVNAKSALKLGHVRGVAMLTAAQAGLSVIAYSPLSIKSAVVGYGRAEKSQVQLMVARLLDLPAPPEPPDAADALAIAICHLHTSATLRRQHAGAR
jgi:crossover junction endodeoxyribonuclease RuvC